jgi:hypothetical protein
MLTIYLVTLSMNLTKAPACDHENDTFCARCGGHNCEVCGSRCGCTPNPWNAIHDA